ncbi:VOC family protein [Streptomyces sp. 8N706]|uniref:VOC family protein n=1 Tax=Streptomyces sp. 8N706 TaxID=3457416 RepID=UPI003FD3BA72
MPRPVHFEIHADDVERARTFYTSVFGWSIDQWGDQPYWIVRTGDESPGIDGGLMPRQGAAPSDDTPVSSFVVTVGVEALDASIASVERHGGRIATPKMAVPTIGWLAYCRDTEGNILGMLQPDESAA